MSTLRSLRLLGAVEAGTVSGAQLETYLTNAGRRSELSVLLSSRGQSRRMAASPLTMSAIVLSPSAINIIFQSATSLTSQTCQEVVKSASAMFAVSNSASSLPVVGANLVAWDLFSTSAHYENNVKNIIANYAGLDPSVYPTVASLISDSSSMSDIAMSPYAMSAVVASAPSVSLLVANASGMGQVAGNPIAIEIVAKKTSIMGTVANSTIAMTEINSRATAVSTMANNVGAITAISNSSTGWTSFQASPHFATNLSAIVANLAGLNPTTYPTLASIISDTSAITKVANSVSSMTALASNNAALTLLANSSNLGTVLAIPTAMAILGPNTTAMTSFLGVSSAWVGLFASSVAKGFMVASTPLVNVIAANAALITYLKTIATTVSATGIPDGSATALQPFPGLPAKVLSLSAKEVGIAATYSNYNFGGSPMTGSQAGATLSLSGTGAGGQPQHIAGYTDMTWNLQAPGVTAATLPILTFVSMV